jgi:hypothetical protein
VRRPKHSRPRQHRCNLVSRLYGRAPGLTTLRSERYGCKGSYPCGMVESPVSDKSLPWHTKVPLLRQCCNTEEIEAGLCAGTHDGAEWALFRSARAIRRGQARMAGMIRPRRSGRERESFHEYDRILGTWFIAPGRGGVPLSFPVVRRPRRGSTSSRAGPRDPCPLRCASGGNDTLSRQAGLVPAIPLPDPWPSS